MTSDISARSLLLVGAGAAVGALLRWGVDAASSELATVVIVNALGCAVIGALPIGMGSRARQFTATGFCGGLTTMSSAAVAVAARLADDRWTSAVAIALLVTVVSIAGFVTGRSLRPERS